MLKVAARIVAGEWRGLVFGMGEAGERVEVEWDLDGDLDFGGTIRGRGRVGRTGMGTGWRWGNGAGSGSVFGGDGEDEEDWWVRRRKGLGGERMAGSFPESDEEEEEGEVGPLDRGPFGGQRSSSISSKSGTEGDALVAGEENNADKAETEAEGFADAEWGVD